MDKHKHVTLLILIHYTRGIIDEKPYTSCVLPTAKSLLSTTIIFPFFFLIQIITLIFIINYRLKRTNSCRVTSTCSSHGTMLVRTLEQELRILIVRILIQLHMQSNKHNAMKIFKIYKINRYLSYYIISCRQQGKICICTQVNR